MRKSWIAPTQDAKLGGKKPHPHKVVNVRLNELPERMRELNGSWFTYEVSGYTATLYVATGWRAWAFKLRVRLLRLLRWGEPEWRE